MNYKYFHSTCNFIRCHFLKYYRVPERVFLFFALIWGIIQVFLTPPFQVPDESNHFLRACQISEFKFIPRVYDNKLGGFLPENLWRTAGIYMDIPFHTDKKMTMDRFVASASFQLEAQNRFFTFFPNTSLYSPVTYIPQTIGIFIGRILNIRPLGLLYMGRLFNLFAWIIIIYMSIRILPFNKWLFLSLAMLPMSIFEAASVSADVVTNGLSFFLVSNIFSIAYNKDVRFGKKEILVLSMVAMLLSFSKNVYFPLVFLVFLIPVKKSLNIRSYLLSVSVVLGISIICVLTGTYIIRNILAQIHPIEQLYGMEAVPKVNPDKQLALIFSNVPEFIRMVANSFYALKQFVFQSFIGILGWVDVVFSNWYYNFAAICLGIIALFEFGENVKLSLFQRFIMLTSCILIVAIFSVTMYLSWANVGEKVLSNLQGRYFIPVVPVLISTFYSRKTFAFRKFLPAISVSLILVSMVISIDAILTRYYH